MSVVIIINKKSSKSPRVMTLVRKLVLTFLDYNILLKAEHISGHLNCLADSRSRSNFQKLKTVSNSRRKALSNLTPALDSLNEEVNFLINMSTASGSWKTYKTAADFLENFRKIYKMNPIWPVPVEMLAQFIAYLSHKGLTASTVSTYISGLSHVHKMNGLHDSTKFYLISKMLEGMKRKNPQQTDIRAPISIDLLKHMIKSLLHACSSHYEAHMFSAAFSLAYFDMLRVSEISLKNRSDESGHAFKFRIDVTSGSHVGHAQCYYYSKKKAREPVAHVHAITSGHVISGYVTSGQGRFR